MRLISQTAHDLRSPLASVAATMELIRDGQLGEISPVQSDCLHAALRQCEYLSTLVGEMLYADGLLGGDTAMVRRSTPRSEIREMVRGATASVLAGKQIELLFDGLHDDLASLYVDPNVVCRLLVNLVVNAERASREGASIFIKVNDDHESGVARWSVVDCGEGISADRLQRVDELTSSKSADSPSDHGLGLMICRQLATLNYSQLKIRSRSGSGTNVTFETPLAHPTAIATAYARFRKPASAAAVRPTLSGGSSTRPTESIRIDPANSWSEVTLGFLGPPPRRNGRVAIGTTTLTPETSIVDADALDRLLQRRLGRFEMSYRTTRRSWVWVLDADHRTVEPRLSRLEEAASELFSKTAAKGGVKWGTPTIVPVERRSLQRLLIDRMTTQTLSASQQSTAGITDRDTVRLGTDPIESSPVAATRLDEELRRLSIHMKRQSERMQSQATALRPR